MGIIELGRKSSELRRKTSGMSNDSDSAKMPPPKFSTSAPSAIKKRKSKRSVDYGSVSALGTARSAPVTPTSDRSPIKVFLFRIRQCKVIARIHITYS